MKQYWDCCNEFWWVAPYAVKGLRRGETLYALDHLNLNIRPMLLQMLEWQAGVSTDFSVSAGKCGKYLSRYLPESVWPRLLATYPTADEADMRRALLDMCALFDETARAVGAALGYHPNYINRLTVLHTGQSLHRYLMTVRVHRALDLIQSTRQPLSLIAQACGFQSGAHFSRCFKAVMGASPSAFRTDSSGEA